MNPTLQAEQNEVLEAASVLFERYGYKKTTIDDIAQEAGIGKGSIYLRFSSKEEIGLAWLRSIHQGLHDELTKTDNLEPKEKIVDFLIKRVMLRFDIFTRHRRSLDEALCSLKSQLEEKKRAFHEQEAAYLSGVIEDGIDKNYLNSNQPLEDARSMIIATNSLLPYSLRPDQIGDRATVELQVTNLAHLLVRALETKNV